MPDGSTVLYSPNWCGTRDRCAKNEKALLYNDKELWGIGRAEGDYVPNDVDVISKEDTIKLIARVFNVSPNDILITDDARVSFNVPINDIEGVYAGEKLAHRWDNKPIAYCNDLTIDFDDVKFSTALKFSNNAEDSDTKPLPRYLVKNLNNQTHLENFKKAGEVLISSINRFPTMKGPGKDEKEGTKSTDICIEQGGQFKGEELGKLISHFNMEGTGTIDIRGKITIKDKAVLPDVYVFCASNKMLNKFGSVHYKIVNIPRFAQTLFESIRKQVDDKVYYWMMAPVVYGGAKDPVKTLKELKSLSNYNINIATMLDCFYKPSSFKDEEEFRFVFFTKKQPIEQKITIHNKNLIKCCSFEV